MGHILFWGYGFEGVAEKTNIYFNHNYVYNPRRIYYIANHDNTDILFQKEECFRSYYNHYYMNNDTLIFREEYDFSSRNNFILDYHKDNNSEFILLDKVDPIFVDKSTKNSLDNKELRRIFVDDIDDEDDQKKHNSYAAVITVVVILIIILILVGGIFILKYIKKRKNEFSIEKLMDFPSS